MADISDSFRQKLVHDAKELSVNGFYVSMPNIGVSYAANALKSGFRFCRKPLAASIPYAFEHVIQNTIVFKVKSEHISFYPVSNAKDFEKFFRKEEDSAVPVGIAAVSHAFKWLSFFYAVQLADGSLCYVKEAAALANLDIPEAYIPAKNTLHCKYCDLLGPRMFVRSVHSCINSFFSWQEFYYDIALHNDVNLDKRLIAKKTLEIGRLRCEIAKLEEEIESEGARSEKFKLDLNEARVEYDLHESMTCMLDTSV